MAGIQSAAAEIRRGRKR